MPAARPLPIAIAIPSFYPGGTERQMVELVRRLDPARWTVHVACFRTEGAWFGRAAEAAASVASFPISGFARADTLRQLDACAQWLKRQRVTVVHTSDLYTNIFFLPAAALARIPVRIGSRREINAGKSLAQIAMQRASYSCAHRVVANARAVRNRLRREAVPASRITVVSNGLDVARFSPRTEAGPPRRLAIVANLRPGKGHDVLIDAMPAVRQQFPDAHLDIIGDGPERARLEDRARAAGAADAVHFVGHRDDIPGELTRADVFVLPSESEAFPNALLEAMAAGLPVVATGVGGIVEVVDDGQTGLLVPPRDPRALAAALCRLLGDPAFAATLGAGGRAVVEARYSFESMVTAIERMYDDELMARAPQRVMQSQLAHS